MICRECCEFCSESAATVVVELICVQTQRQLQLTRAIENAMRLLCAERDAFMKDIHGIDQSFAGKCRHHLIDDEVDVFVASASILGRQCMCAQKPIHDLNS